MEPFAATMERVAALVRELRHDGHEIEYIDAGGGLGIAYEGGGTDVSAIRAGGDARLSITDFADYASEYAQALLGPLRGLKVRLLLEPGRAIVGPAGALLTTVSYRKTNNSKKFLIVDAAMNDLLRPSLYGAFHEIVPVEVPREDRARETVDVVGPICESGDFLARDRELPLVDEGELIAILDTGAYGMALASNYNSRPRPAEALVDGKSVKLIRRRETAGDLMRYEL
jgi:diaminopimelate decarboxylase